MSPLHSCPSRRIVLLRLRRSTHVRNSPNEDRSRQVVTMRTMGSEGRHEHRPEARFDDGKRQHLPMWEDPSIVGINRREMHVPLKCFESRAQSLLFTVNDTAPTRNVLPLSPALWRFKHTVGVDKAPPVLESVGCDETNAGDGDWVDIQVPQSWETAGHGKPIYTNFRSRPVVQQGCCERLL